MTEAATRSSMPSGAQPARAGQRGPDQADPFPQDRQGERVGQRTPGWYRAGARLMHVDGEERPEGSQVVQDGGYDATPTGSGSCSSACGAGMAGCRNRSSRGPKTSAIVVQMSSWFRIEYQRNFHSTSALKPG